MCFDMGQLVDLTGKRFGRLAVIVISDKRDSSGSVYWECKCDCGNIVTVNGRSLRGGNQRSCGCYHHDIMCAQHNRRTHGGTGDRLFHVWRGIIDRCCYTSHNRYKDYGGRGIYICEEWKHDYGAFRAWAVRNGYDPDAPRGMCTIDRIDVDGPYAPWNCRWVDMKTQSLNKRKKVV